MNPSFRVLHIGTEMSWRGGENQVRYLMDGLRDRGVESFLAYPKGSPAIQRLSSEFDGSYSCLSLPSRKDWDLRSVYRLVRFCKAHEIDILDAHSSGGHSLGLRVKTWLPKVKLIVHRRVDNVPADNMFTRHKYFDSRVDQFVAISGAIGRILQDYGVPPKKISVVKSATDGSRFANQDRKASRESWLKRLNLPKETVLIGNASALTPQKGYEVLIQSLPFLVKENLPFHCVIAGDGGLRPALESMVQNLGLQNRVTFLGFIREVDSLLLGLDVLCVPSNNEGLGTIILDGILAGNAVVATAVGGIPEIIFHGRTGLISPKGDVLQLAQNLATVIANPTMRESLVRGAQEHVNREFSLQSMIEGNMKVYSRVLNTSTSSQISG